MFTDHLPPWEYNACKGKAFVCFVHWHIHSTQNTAWHLVGT